MMPARVTVLGATGSIGTSTLRVIAAHPDKLELVAIAACTNWEKLAAIAQEFEGRRRGEFMETMANLAVADTVTPVELSARRSQKRLLVTPKVFRAAGERLLLCQLDPAEAAQPVSDELSANLARL